MQIWLQIIKMHGKTGRKIISGLVCGLTIDVKEDMDSPCFVGSKLDVLLHVCVHLLGIDAMN